MAAALRRADMSKLKGTLRRCALAAVLVVLGVIQAPAQQELHITISRIGGTVEVQNAVATKGQWVAAKKDQVIGAGWNLRTAASSKVQLVFPKDNVVILKENSVLSVDKLDAGGGAQLSAKSGGLLADIKNALSPGSTFEVKTPNALAVVRGTKYGVQITPAPKTGGAGGGAVSMNFMFAGKPMPVIYADTSFAVLLGSGGGKCVSGDADGDGKDELLMPGTTAAMLLPAVQKIREAANRSSRVGSGGMPSVKRADVNGDGRQDMVVVLPTGETKRAAGDGSVVPQTQEHVLLNAGDLDQDGQPDYIVEDGAASGHVLEALALEGKLPTDQRTQPVKVPGKLEYPNLVSGADLQEMQQASSGDGSVRVAAGDVNGDGIDDVTLNFTSKSSGDGSVRLQGVGDVDGDLLPDFVYQRNETDLNFIRRLYQQLLGRDVSSDGGAAVDAAGAAVTSPRDHASGLPTGKRTAEDGDGAVTEVYTDLLGRSPQDDNTDSAEAKVVVRGWDPEKKQEIVGKADAGIVSGQPVKDWIDASLSMNYMRKSGELQAADFKRDTRQVREFTDGVLTEADLNGDGRPDLKLSLPTDASAWSGRPLSVEHGGTGGTQAHGAGGGGGAGKVSLRDFSLYETADVDGDGVPDYRVEGGKPTAAQFAALIDSLGEAMSKGSGGGNASPIYDAQGLEVDSPLYKGKEKDKGTTTTTLPTGSDAGGGPQVRMTGQDNGPKSPRDPATGQASGKRQHGMIQAGDVNGDGTPDVVVDAQDVDELRQAAAATKGGVNVAAGDVNGDGRADVVITWQDPTRGSQNRGAQAPAGTHHTVKLLATGDVTGDGAADFVVGDGSTGSGELGILIGLLLPAVQKNGELWNNSPYSEDSQRMAGGVLTGAEWKQLQAADKALADRDAASGQATGKSAPKDHATGLATGKRMHKPFVITTGDVDGDGSVDLTVQLEYFDMDSDDDGGGDSARSSSPRDAASGQATGKRAGKAKYKNIVLKRIGDVDGDGLDDYSGDGSDLEALRSYSAGHFQLDIQGDNDPLGRVGAGPHVVRPRRGLIFGGDRIVPAVQAGQNGPIKWMAPESQTRRSGGEAAADGSVRVATGDVNGDGFEDVTFDVKYLNAGGVVVVLDGVGDLDGDGLMDYTPHGGDGDGPKVEGILIGLTMPSVQGGTHSPQGSKRESGGGGAGMPAGVLTAAEWNQLVAQDKALAAPRDAASGQATGKRTHKPFSLTTGDFDGDGSVDLAIDMDVAAPRDSASGQATGKSGRPGPTRFSHIVLKRIADVDGDGLADYSGTPEELDALRSYAAGHFDLFDGQEAAGFNQTHNQEGKGRQNGALLDGGYLTESEWKKLQAADKALADRDAASGQATGKSAPRDAASGQATGKRMHKPFVITLSDVDGDGAADLQVQLEYFDADGDAAAGDGSVRSPRDSASGQATGKRAGKAKYKNIVLKRIGDVDGDGLSDYGGDPGDIEALRSYSAGHFQLDIDKGKLAESDITSPRDHASGLPTGKRLGAGGDEPDFVVSGAKIRDWVKNSYDGKDARQRGGVRVAAGDVNGDGAADLTISFDPPPAGQGAPPAARKGLNAVNVKLLATGDVDGDGVPDFVLEGGASNEGTLNVLIGLLLPAVQKIDDDGSGAERGTPSPGGGGAAGLTIDEAGTGKSHPQGGGGAGIAIDEGGTSKPHPKGGKAGLSLGDLNGDSEDEIGVDIGDVDQDGLPDYLVEFSHGPRQTASTDGSFNQKSIKGGHYAVSNFHIEIDGVASGYLNGVAAGDLNGDGVADIIVGSKQLPSDASNPAGRARRNIWGTGGANTGRVKATGDLDGDGVPEELTAFVVDDEDGDGLADLVVSGGAGGGAAAGRVSKIDSFTIKQGIKADLDNDGVLDALDDDSDGDGVADLIVGDLDGDGRAEHAFPGADGDGDGSPDYIVLSGFSHDGGSNADRKAHHDMAKSIIGNIRARTAGGGGGGGGGVIGGDLFSGRELKEYFQTGDKPTQGQVTGKVKNSAGTYDPTPATFTWHVDTTPPDTRNSSDGTYVLTITRSGDRSTKTVKLVAAGDVDGDGAVDYAATGDVDTLRILIGLIKASDHQLSPRDHQSGLPTGKRQYDPRSVAGDGGFLSGLDWAQLQTVELEIVSPRDAASGLPTGKRMHKPITFKMADVDSDGIPDLDMTVDLEGTAIQSPRDSASGLPTGKRMHKPLFYGIGDVNGDGSPDYLGSTEDRKLLRDIASGMPTGKREAGSGIATGKRQYDPRSVTGDGGFLGGLDWAQLQTVELEIVSPRDSASGLPTGKRMHKPITFKMADIDGDGIQDLDITVDLEGTAIVSPRDSASGLPTGKRMHKPLFYGIGDVDGDGAPDYLGSPEDRALLHEITSPRDHASGLPTGKRQYDPASVAGDGGFLSGSEWEKIQAAEHEILSPRDAASGLPTGKRMYKPLKIRFVGADNDSLQDLEVTIELADDAIVSPRDSASGLPTGKRMHKPLFYGIGDVDGDGKADFLGTPADVALLHEVVSPRDAASGLPTGKRQPGGGTDSFFGYRGKVEVTNGEGTSFLTPDTTVTVGAGEAPSPAGPSSPDADAFLKDLEDPALFEQFETTAAGYHADLDPIRKRLQADDRQLRQIEGEWPKYERTQDIGKLIILWSQVLKLVPDIDKADGDIWQVFGVPDSKPEQYDAMTSWMQEHGVPDTDLPVLLKNLRDRINELELDIQPFLQGNQQLLDQLNGLLDQGNPALGLRGDIIDTDNDGVGDATEISIGSDPLHNNGADGFIKLDSPDDRASFEYPTDKTIEFEFEPLDSDVKVTYDLVLEAGGKQLVRHNARETERFDLASLVGPQGQFTDVLGPGGALQVSWHVEAKLSRSRTPLPQIKSATRTFTINTPTNQTVEVNLAAGSASSKLGTPVIVNGSITDVTALGDWEIQVRYDPALLAFTQGVKRGLFANSTVFFNDANGLLTISGSAPRGSAGLTGAGDIFQLTFNPLLPGRSEVEVSRVTLHDSLGRPINGQPGDSADIGVTASSTGTPQVSPGGGGGTPRPPAPPVTPQVGGDTADVASLGPLELTTPRDTASVDYPAEREVQFGYKELRTKLDVNYNLVLTAGGAMLVKRNYVSGDALPIASLIGKGTPLAGAVGPDSLDIDWHVEALIDTGGAKPMTIPSETRRLSIKLPANKSVTFDISSARGKTRGISVGDPVFVRGGLSQVNALGEWTLTVDFDASVLSFSGGRKMGLFANANVRFDQQGQGRLVISGQLPGSGLSGDGDCFELEFSAKGDGTCAIEPENPELKDTLGRPISGNAGSAVDVDVVDPNGGGSAGTPGKGRGGKP
jgi:hypothetical protein